MAFRHLSNLAKSFGTLQLYIAASWCLFFEAKPSPERIKRAERIGIRAGLGFLLPFIVATLLSPKFMSTNLAIVLFLGPVIIVLVFLWLWVRLYPSSLLQKARDVVDSGWPLRGTSSIPATVRRRWRLFIIIISVSILGIAALTRNAVPLPLAVAAVESLGLLLLLETVEAAAYGIKRGKKILMDSIRAFDPKWNVYSPLTRLSALFGTTLLVIFIGSGAVALVILLTWPGYTIPFAKAIISELPTLVEQKEYQDWEREIRLDQARFAGRRAVINENTLMRNTGGQQRFAVKKDDRVKFGMTLTGKKREGSQVLVVVLSGANQGVAGWVEGDTLRDYGLQDYEEYLGVDFFADLRKLTAPSFWLETLGAALLAFGAVKGLSKIRRTWIQYHAQAWLGILTGAAIIVPMMATDGVVSVTMPATLFMGFVLITVSVSWGFVGTKLLNPAEPISSLLTGDKETVIEHGSYVDSADPETHSTRGAVLAGMQLYPEALKAFEDTLALDSKHVLGHVGRGAVLGELGRYDEALEAFHKATHIDPNNPDAYYRRGLLLMNIGRSQEATDAFDDAIKLKQDFSDALASRSATLMRLYRFEEALESCDRALSLDPKNKVAMYNKACALSCLERGEEALRSLEHALARGGELCQHARIDPSFNFLREHPRLGPRFRRLVLS